MSLGRILEPDWLWTPDGYKKGWSVTVDEQGLITRVGPAGPDPSSAGPSSAPATPLPGRALVPGFVNAHSHAFQRGLRGRGETFPRGAGSFWTWREAMYALVEDLDETTFHALCLQAFREMLAAGITTVGEFHYFHHLDDELGFTADRLLLDAAQEAGIRLVLLYAFYRTGGIGRPLKGGQTRFSTPSLDVYFRRLDALRPLLRAPLQSLGIVAHSLRAVDLDELQALHAYAVEHGLVFHLHLEEQVQEIEACRDAYGKAPMDLLLDRVDPAATPTTAVHCTHTDPDAMKRYLSQGGRVCICPLTEANLADGIADVPAIAGFGQHRLSLGTDSNARISMLEEIRWLEYVQRLSRERRGIVVDDHGALGRALLDVAVIGGAASLGLDLGELKEGMPADMLSIRLDHPSLAFAPDPGDGLLEAWLLGADNGSIDEVCVGGRWIRPF